MRTTVIARLHAQRYNRGRAIRQGKRTWVITKAIQRAYNRAGVRLHSDSTRSAKRPLRSSACMRLCRLRGPTAQMVSTHAYAMLLGCQPLQWVRNACWRLVVLDDVSCGGHRDRRGVR
eukprot:3414335-Prymnesium_polylepis.1